MLSKAWTRCHKLDWLLSIYRGAETGIPLVLLKIDPWQSP